MMQSLTSCLDDSLRFFPRFPFKNCHGWAESWELVLGPRVSLPPRLPAFWLKQLSFLPTLASWVLAFKWGAAKPEFANTVCRNHAQDPAFAPGTSEVAVGLWPFCILLFTIAPTAHVVQLFLVPYSFFVLCCLRRCLSRCKHCSKGSKVLAYLISMPVLRIFFKFIYFINLFLAALGLCLLHVGFL